MIRTTNAIQLGAALLLLACGDDSSGVDGGSRDAARDVSVADAAGRDAAERDASGDSSMDGGGGTDAGTTMLPPLDEPVATGPDGASVGATAIGLSERGAPIIAARRPNPTDDLAMFGLSSEGWSIRSLDLDGDFPVVAFDSVGFPHVLYVRQTASVLRYARWDGAGWIFRTLDRGVASASRPPYLDLAVDDNDDAHVVWYHPDDGDARYARWNGSSFTREEIETEGEVGQEIRLFVDAEGGAHVTYLRQDSTREVRYATNASGSWVAETVPTTGLRVSDPITDLAVASDGSVHVAYGADDGVRLTVRESGDWNDTVIAAGQIRTLILELDDADRAHLAYRCTGDSCRRAPCMGICDTVPPTIFYARENGAEFEEFEIATNAGALSMTLDESSAPHFAYATNIGFGGGLLQYANFDLPRPPVPSVTQTVGASGGTIRTEEDALVMEIPEGALAADTEITIRELPRSEWDAELRGANPVGEVWEFQPDGLTFSTPAVVSLRESFEDTLASMRDDGFLASYELQLRSGGTTELVNLAVPTRSEGARLAGEVEHFSELWRERVERLWALTLTPSNHNLFVGQRWTLNAEFVDLIGPARTEDLRYRTSAEEISAALLGDMPSDVFTSNARSGALSFSSDLGTTRQFEITFRCTDTTDLDATTPFVGAFTRTGQRSRSTTCLRRPTCTFDEALARAIGGILGDEPTECNGLEVDVDLGPTQHPDDTGDGMPPPDPGQGDETQVSAHGSFNVNLSDAEAADVFGAGGFLDCAETDDDREVLCDDTTMPPAGDYRVIYNVANTPFPLADEDHFFQIITVIDQDGSDANNATASPSTPQDPLQGGDRVYNAFYRPTDSTWILRASDLSGGTPTAIPTTARLVITGNVAMLIVSAADLGVAAPEYRVGMLRHVGFFGRVAPFNGAFDYEPPALAPLYVPSL
ncbi:MAG: hypothetical protein AAGE52_28595 [Myxococcota bacterium]